MVLGTAGPLLCGSDRSLRVRRCLPIELAAGVAGRFGGRRLLSLEGGNCGVVAQDVVLLNCYGDCNRALGISRASMSMKAALEGASGLVFGE